MKIKCSICGKIFDSQNITVESIRNSFSGNDVFFYCDECYKKETEKKETERSKSKSWKW